MKFWILQTGEPLHSDGGAPRPMRAMNLADALVARGHSVEVFSTGFYHQEKRHRTRKFQTIHLHEQLTVHLIPSSGYKRNIGLGRLIDHAQIAFGLWRLLHSKRFSRPNLAFVGYPPIEVAWIMLRWLKRNEIPSFIDVKDQWPLLFVEAVPTLFRPIARVVFSPYYWLGRRAMRYATAITSMSEPFLLWALDFCGRQSTEADLVVPLVPARTSVTAMEISDALNWWEAKGINLEKLRCFSFVGSLSQAFNFSALQGALVRLQQLHPDCLVVICGSGAEQQAISKLFNGLSNVIFPGWIDAPKIAALMQFTVATLAPYRNTSNFQLNIPNKILDSFSFGQPVVTALQGAVQDLIVNEGVGIVCPDTVDGWLDAFCRLLEDTECRTKMSLCAARLYADRYDAANVYGNIVVHMENIAAKNKVYGR